MTFAGEEDGDNPTVPKENGDVQAYSMLKEDPKGIQQMTRARKLEKIRPAADSRSFHLHQSTSARAQRIEQFNGEKNAASPGTLEEERPAGASPVKKSGERREELPGQTPRPDPTHKIFLFAGHA